MPDANPILNNPYEPPDWHYATNLQGELDYSRPVKGRRVFRPEVQTIPVRQGPQGELMGGHASHPFPVKKGQKIAVRVVSQFGEETTKVLEVSHSSP